MLSLFTVLVWLIVGVVVLAILIVLIPYHLRLTATTYGTSHMLVEVRLFSHRLPKIFAVQKTFGDRARRTAQKPREKRASAQDKARSGVPSLLPRIVRRLPELIAQTLSGFHFDVFRLKGEFGLHDPADTGALYGHLMPIVYGFAPAQGNVDIVPRFDKPCLNGEVDIRLHMIPIRLAWPSLKIVLSEIWRSKWR